MSESDYPPALAVTKGPKHHFFGYYDKCPWDATGRYMLALETDFMARPPVADDIATIGLIDTYNGNEFRPIAATTAWCWQQSSMLQWLPSAPDRKIIYNVRRENDFAAEIRDVFTGAVRELPHSIYCVSPDGRHAIGHNFARVADTRPGYGYVGFADKFKNDPLPEKDGLFHIDLETGDVEFIISIAQIAAMGPEKIRTGYKHWFNHIQFNTDGSRFVFLHRCRRCGADNTGEWGGTYAYTSDIRGRNVNCIYNQGRLSHFDWMNETGFMAWAALEGQGEHFFMLEDMQTNVGRAMYPESVPADGHNSFSPDRKWIVNDTYPSKDDRKRTLMLLRVDPEERIDIGRFYAPPELREDFRCDLHPRWSRDGKKICFDSAHEGVRQMYVIDVSRIVG